MSSILFMGRLYGKSTGLTSKALSLVPRRSYSTDRPLFKKILIANRGEIALRVMRTAKKMGIKTVAVFSDPDRHSMHVEMADEAVHIGPALSSQSYLRIDRIIEACKRTGADAVHPGYGFLSENSEFVKECEKNGITFIGPPTDAMNALGDKINSKKVAEKAGVSIVPGFMGEVQSVEEALKIANKIGYPVMVKASAGGGGKGMRIAWNDEEAAEGFRLSKQEAKAAFGDDRLLIEKFIESPRHIEFQILADGHGNVIYLPERECSIQRRNQKVIEEAPSPFIKPEVRAAMGNEACQLAKAVSYKNTGTVEFLIDPQSKYYFLEMNTRLQVEHPITEEITNIDIVEQMIRIAAGKKLSITQDDVKIHGWAMESRVYAEDPLRGFLPSIGKLTRYQEPMQINHHDVFDVGSKESDSFTETETPWIRSDSGIEEGSEISIYYDPLITKLVTKGTTRKASIQRMKRALDNYVIRGVNHNVCFLRDVMENAKFVKGDLSTKFIPEEYPNGFHGHVLSKTEEWQLKSIVAAIHWKRLMRDATITGGQYDSWDVQRHYQFKVKINGAVGGGNSVGASAAESSPISFDTYDVYKGENPLLAISDSSQNQQLYIDVSDWRVDEPIINIAVTPVPDAPEDHRFPLTAQLVSIEPFGYKIQFIGTIYDVSIFSPTEEHFIQHMPKPKSIDAHKALISPMAGQLISIAVQSGQKVNIGQELAVVEAMKMQNVLRAAKDGVVKTIKAKPGTSVALEEILIEFE